MTPSEILNRAAGRIRDLASAATPPPWTVRDSDSERYIDGDDRRWLRSADDARPVGEACGCCSVGTIDERTADWIAALSPAVAPHLEAWLRSAADDAEEIGPDPWAVAFARALLGEYTP